MAQQRPLENFKIEAPPTRSTKKNEIHKPYVTCQDAQKSLLESYRKSNRKSAILEKLVNFRIFWDISHTLYFNELLLQDSS